MWDVSPRFLDALRRSHGVAFNAAVWAGGVKIYDGLPVLSGSMRLDTASQVWRAADFTVAGADLQPWAATDTLSPLVGEVALSSGVVLADGQVEWVPIGRLRIDDVDWDPAAGTSRVTASDRMAAVASAGFERAMTSQPGATVVADIVRVLRDVDPTWQIDDRTGSTERTPAVPLVWEDDRVAAVQELAATIGASVWCDPVGRFVIGRPAVLGAAATPVWWVDAGPRGVLLSANPSRTRTGVWNAAKVTGADPDGAPLIGLAYDLDPTSPTRWGGPFGRVVESQANSAAWSQQMVDNAAVVLLTQGLGRVAGLSFTCLPNPALDGGDLVLVRYPGGRTEQQVIAGLTLDFAAAAMSGTVRATR